MESDKALQYEVLKFFYEEGMEDVTPSYIVYRLKLGTGEAGALLDGMVRNGALELFTDNGGNLLYRLPQAERQRLSRVHQSLGGDPPQSPGRPDPRSGMGGARPRGSLGPHSEDGSLHGAPPSRGRKGGRAPRGGPPGGPSFQYPNSPSSRPGSGAPYGAPPGPQPRGPQSQGSYPQGPYPQGPHPQGPHPQGPHQVHGPQAMVPYGSPQGQMQPQGAHYGYREPNPAHAPMLAASLSLCFPGVGQFYNGQAGKGISMMFLALVMWLFLMGWVVHIWSGIDAHEEARRIQTGVY